MSKALDSIRRGRRVALASALCAVMAGAPSPWAADGAKPKQEALSLQRFSQLLVTNNPRAVAARAQAAVAETQVQKASAQFQPVLRMDLTSSEQNEVNSPEDAITRGEEGTDYERRSDDFSVEVSSLLPTGATVTGRTSLSRFWSSAFELLGDPDTAQDDRFRSAYDVSVTQPLLRDRGVEVTRTPITLAEMDQQVADLSRRDTEVLALGDGVNVFYDLVMAHHRRTAAERKVEMATELSETAARLLGSGRLDGSALSDVEISRVQFESSLLQASETQLDLSNQAAKALQLKQMGPDGLVPIDLKLPSQPEALPPLEELVENAWALRPDLQASKLLVERQVVESSFHENQLRPRLDAKVNYGYSGLALRARSAFGDDYRATEPTWSVGVVFETKVGSDRAMEANLAAAKIKQQQAADERDALLNDIRQDIRSAVAMVKGAAARWELWKGALERERQNLELERKRFDSGRSDIRSLLLAEERLINVDLQVIEQRVAYARALALLSLTQGQAL
jgi:outer membrane protein TolC